MHQVRKDNMPLLVGSSYEFVGAEHGETGVSVFPFYGKPVGTGAASASLGRYPVSRVGERGGQRQDV